MEYYVDTSITELNLSNKKITSMKQITNLHELTNLIKLDLSDNEINIIEGLENLTNLQTLDLSNNKINQIQGLTNLTNLKVLWLNNNKISIIKGLYNLTNLQVLCLNENKISIIINLVNLTNLKVLYLSNNNITNIYGLNNLVNLQELYLAENNIHIIEGLDNLTNLIYLNLRQNNITIINNLDNLTNLLYLNLGQNNITIINNLDNLTNLGTLYLYYNNIMKLPLTLCNFRNINEFYYDDNPIEYIPLPVQRWLVRLNNRVTSNNIVYNDRQNIHNHHIQNSFQISLSNILYDKYIYDLDFIKQHIVDNEILTQNTKELLISYIESREEHSIYLINYGDLLRYVYTRIINNDNLLSILNEEVKDSLCMCFTGRMTRLLNVLSGFYDDIEIQISDSEQITNIIMSLKNRVDETDLKDAVKQELTERQFSNDVINEWLEYI